MYARSGNKETTKMYMWCVGGGSSTRWAALIVCVLLKWDWQGVHFPFPRPRKTLTGRHPSAVVVMKERSMFKRGIYILLRDIWWPRARFRTPQNSSYMTIPPGVCIFFFFFFFFFSPSYYYHYYVYGHTERSTQCYIDVHAHGSCWSLSIFE